MRKSKSPRRTEKRIPARRMRPYSKRVRTSLFEIIEGLLER